MPTVNHWGQPIGPALPNFQAPPWPAREPLTGRFARVEPLDASAHAVALFAEIGADAEGRTWTYLPYGPFTSMDEFRDWLRSYCLGKDPLFFTIIDARTGTPLGLASYLRINPADAVIEVGHLIFSPRLQRTAIATEAMYLMMIRAFELGYRRYEWKCDSLNANSRAAAERLGFQFEGIFRQDRIYKGRSRDTAWFSVIDAEWAMLRDAFDRWLAPENFDAAGKQRRTLREFREP
jgi:RimJ/RimL family protein N-acetyltransferase